MVLDAGRLDELKLQGTLPSPSGVGLAILRLTRSEDYSIEELRATIQADPALTGRILKLANSATIRGGEPVANIAKAVMRLGVNTLRNLALGFSLVSSNRSGAAAAFDYDAYWAHSLATALCARELAPMSGSVSPADAFTCGLLGQIGVLALANIHPERYFEAVEQGRGRPSTDVVRIEREHLGTDHSELGAALLDDWLLPSEFSFAVGHYEDLEQLDHVALPADDARRLAVLLHVAHRAGDLFMHGGLKGPKSGALLELECILGVDRARLGEALDRAALAWSEWGATLSLPTLALPSFAESATTVQPACEHPDPDALPEDDTWNIDWPRPAVPAPVEMVHDQPMRAAGRAGLRVLAVDDDRISLQVLVRHLARDGHEVLQAGNGREALEASMADPPQLIVTDWMMPEMDGIEFCQALRMTPAGRGIYVLILTAREDEERIVEAFDAGADDYVVKPFNARILLARVRAGQRMIELREQAELDRRERNRQIAEMALLNRKLSAAALTDMLTKLPNRRYAMKRLEQELARSGRTSTQLAVMMLDIDWFKSVNDQFGHDAGDRVLQEVSAVLRRATRSDDVVCRLGGEEFLIICSNCDIEEASRSAERICKAVAEHRIDIGSERYNVTVSIGVAEVAENDSVDELLKRSDRRVYAAKGLGRNCVVAHEDEQDAGASERRSA